MAQRKGDVEFIVAGEDHFSQILRSIMSDVQNMKQQVAQAGRQMDDSMRHAADSTRRSGEAVKTMSDRLREIGHGVQHVKQLKSELDRVEDSARDAGREMERGFRDGEKAADRMAKQAAAVKQRLVEVAREARGLVDAINSSTAGLQGFVGDQVRRGVYIGGLAVTGFAAHSVMRTVDKEYEFAKLGSVLKSSYYQDGKLNEAAFNRDFADLQAFIQQQGLRKDRETDTMGMIGMAMELAKNNMDPAQVKAALPVVADFAQATGMDPDVAAKYLANKLEAAKMDYTTENFARIADQFVKTVDMSSLDPRDLLYAERYTDFGNAIGGVDYAISQAMQVLLSKVSVEGETAGTALRTLFIESSKLDIPDSARKNVSSEKVGRAIDALIKEVNAVNKAVDADKSVAADQKGNEKILRKAAIMNRYMSQLTSDEQIEVGSLLFGKEAASVTTIFANDGYKDLLETIDAIRNSTGITKRYADDRANTSKGEIVALSKAVEEIQGKVGKSLQPLLDATTRQLLSLAAVGKFSFEEINKGAEESADMLAKELNPEIAEVFEQLTRLTTNGFQIGVSLTPLAQGAGKAIINLLNGDVSGAVREIVLAIDATDLRIENLPGELQGLANAAKNAAIALGVLAAYRTGKKVYEAGKEVWDDGQKVGEVVRGKKQGNAPSINDDSRTIRANVVNVYGGQVNGGKTGSGTNTPVPVPSGSGNTGGKPQTPEGGPNKKPGKWKTGWGKAASRGGQALLIASLLGLTDDLPEEMQDAIDVYGWGSTLNNWLGNPLGALEAGTATALGGTAAVGGSWFWALKSYGEYMDENRIKNYQNKYGPVGADKWLDANYKRELEPASTPAGYTTGVYIKETNAVIDFLLSKKGTKYEPYLKDFSEQLLKEAKVNASNGTKYMLPGYNGGDIESFLQKRLNEYILLNVGTDARSLDVEKRLRREADKEREEHRLKVQASRDRIQYLREIEHDPFVKGSYKRQLLDEMTQRSNTSTSSNMQLIPTLMAHLSKLEEKPITVHTDHNLKVVVEDNRAVQVHQEGISEYASRTYNNRTLTPYQAIKMRQLE